MLRAVPWAICAWIFASQVWYYAQFRRLLTTFWQSFLQR